MLDLVLINLLSSLANQFLVLLLDSLVNLSRLLVYYIGRRGSLYSSDNPSLTRLLGTLVIGPYPLATLLVKVST